MIAMPQTMATDVLAMLQVEPLYYRNFGYLWWAVKAQLKGLGHGSRELYLLGDYRDPEIDAYYATLDLSDAEMVQEAMAHQHAHRSHNRNNPHGIRLDGEAYYVYDEDAE